MANRRLLDFSNHIAAPAADAAAAASVVATITSNNRIAHQIHHHGHLAKAKTLFLSLALVSCLISINCASFGRHQPKYRLLPATDDSINAETALLNQLEDLSDQLKTSGGHLQQRQPAREKLSPSEDLQLLSHLLDWSSSGSGSNFAPAGNSYSAANPIQFVGLDDERSPSEFGYVQSDPADYQPHHSRLLPAVDLRDPASFGRINSGDSLDLQRSTDPSETSLSLSTQQQSDRASVLPAGVDKIPAYFVGEKAQTIDNQATAGNDELVAGGGKEKSVVKTVEQPDGKLTTLLEDEDEVGGGASKSSANKKPSSDKDQLESKQSAASGSSSKAGDAKQEQQAANKTDYNEHQQQLLRRFVSLWRNNASSKAAEQSGSSQQEATGGSQGNSGGFLSSLFNGIAQCVSYLSGGGSSSSSSSSDKQPVVVVKEISAEQDQPDNKNNKATEAANQDKSRDDGNKGINRANTKLSVSTPIESDAATKSEMSSTTAEDKQEQTSNINWSSNKQQTSEENNDDDQESAASSMRSLSSGANVESSPVGTFMASELDSAKVVGSGDDVQIASSDDNKQHNLITTTSRTGDSNSKRNIFRLTTPGSQHYQQEPSTAGERKVSLMRHSSLILPLGSSDELVVSSSPQQSNSLLGRYVSSPIGGSGASSDGANLVFNLRNSQLSKHQSAATTEAGGLSLDDEYTQMSHRSYSRRLHPDGEVYGQFAGLRPSPQGVGSSFARALPIVGAGGVIRDDQGGSFGDALGYVQKTNDAYFLVMVAAFCVMAMAVVLATGLLAYRVQQQRKSTSDSDYPTYGVVGPNNMNGKCGGAAAFVGGYFASNLNNHHANGGAGGGGPGSTGGSSLSISGKHLADLYSVSGDSGIVSGVHNSSHSKNQHVHSGTLSAICGGGATGGGVGSAKRANPNANLDGSGSQSGSGGNQQAAGNNNFMANQNAARMYHYQHQKQQMIISDRASTGRHTSASDLDSEDENDDGSYTVYECPGLASAHEMEIKNPLFNDDRSP